MVMMNTVVDTVRKMDIEQLKIVADEIKLRRTLLGNQLTRSLIVCLLYTSDAADEP